MNKHGYCSGCGASLKMQPVRAGGFDPYTGKPLYLVRYYCPNKQRGISGWFDRHADGMNGWSYNFDGGYCFYVLTDDGEIDWKRGVAARK